MNHDTLTADGRSFRDASDQMRVRISDETLAMATHIQKHNGQIGLPRSLEFCIASCIDRAYEALRQDGLVPPNP